ncbi:hypothetical protein [Maritalea porphyrae]|uniref:hypothetical protein n=1 Tax=Maritalea porphyrae TaxID=880732 RepID=UPI0022AF0727|nr:hypothetical protein [Maritalea porphyrae]MCZ4270898.1 hypothetical protein [Maritalea porphyrae]
MTKVNLHIKARDQFLPYLNRSERWSCVVAHRRAGKTVACIQDIVKRAIEHTGREPRFAYIAPTYTQAKDVAWSYLKEFTASIPGVEKSESELSVTLPHNGARIRLYGAENYDRLRGLYLDGAIIDEAGDQDPRAWSEVIRAALSDRKGWATFIGTPKGRNSFYKRFIAANDDPAWMTLRLRASETGIIDAAELEDAKRNMTPEAYAQEYETSFEAAVKGAYYAAEVEQAEKEDRITSVPHDKAADTIAAWDLGIGDSTSIWIGQIVGREHHMIHYYENSGVGLDHYVDHIKSLPYPIHQHILPHDAAARELQTGKSRIQFLRDRGLSCNEPLPQHAVDDGINAVRMKFNQIWFDKKGCERGIDCLRMYRSEYNEKLQTLKPRPLHDWASHGSDAFRYWVMGAHPIDPGPTERPEPDYRNSGPGGWMG